nr:sigma-70 family RNA polymerase sigma factor [uncultured Carboxylicivirga sp.]
MEINQLIKNCQNGDKDAFGQLVTEYGNYVFSVVFRIVNNEADAEDISQNVFVKAWQNINKYNHEKAKFTTWLYTIAARMSLDYLKTSRKKVELTDVLKSDVDIEKEIDLKELGTMIYSATDQLSDQQKLIFVLRDLEELDVDDVVEITGFSRKQIKDNLYVARKKVKEKLGRLLKIM